MESVATMTTTAEVPSSLISAPKYTVKDLLSNISSLVDQGNYELAREFCLRALELEPDNVDALVKAGEVELELGQTFEAKEFFRRAVRFDPGRGYSKYMFLGQMSTGLEAVEYFEKGVRIMVDERQRLPHGSEEASRLSRTVSTALCAMTEIYLTDCCFEEDAEQKCEACLRQAVEVDPGNPEVYQLLASVRLSQIRNDEAKEALKKSLSLWIDLDPDDPAVPEYESRLALTKLLIETGAYARAISVLESLQRENDEYVDLWYLYGWAYYVMGEEGVEQCADANDKLEHWEDARECLKKAIKLHEMLEWDDEGILQHSNELLANINAVLPHEDDDDDDDDDNDNDNDNDEGGGEEDDGDGDGDGDSTDNTDDADDADGADDADDVDDAAVLAKGDDDDENMQM